MERQEICEKVMSFVKGYCEGDVDISSNSHLSYDLGLDSLDKLDISNDIEMEFEVYVNDDDIADWETVDDIVNTVCKLVDN